MHTRSPGVPVSAALLLTLAVFLFRATSAHAEFDAAEGSSAAGPVAGAEMQSEMHRYFTGEGRGGVWLMGAGVAGAALGTGLLFQQGNFGRGLAYPTLAFGAIELIGGLAFYVNTQRRVPRFDRQLGSDPRAFREAELARIGTVNRQMRMLEVMEISLILAGGTMTCVGALGQGDQKDVLAGVGTGLMIETAVLLIYDQLAARRALRYTDRLSRFTF